MTRLVRYSLPPPPSHRSSDKHTRLQLAIAEQMAWDDTNSETFAPMFQPAEWLVLATPDDTDAGQCWSEEFFSFSP